MLRHPRLISRLARDLTPTARCFTQQRGTRSLSSPEKRDISYAAPLEHVPQSAQPKSFRMSYTSAAMLAAGFGGAAFAFFYPPLHFAIHPHTKASNRTASSEPSHTSAELERALHELPVIEALRMNAFLKGESDLWNESRLFSSLAPAHSTHLISNALMGPDKMGIAPFVRTRKDGAEGVVVFHIGSGLCGHKGIIHGGLIATLFDQHLATLAFLSLPARTGVTANLNINYRAPARADQFIVLRMKRDDPAAGQASSGRKVVVRGTLETTDGTVLAEASAVIVQPRDVQKLLAQR